MSIIDKVNEINKDKEKSHDLSNFEKRKGVDLSEFKNSNKKVAKKKTSLQTDPELIELYKEYIKKENLNTTHGVLMNKILKDWIKD